MNKSSWQVQYYRNFMFTQSSEPEAVARASELGVYEYLNKPLDSMVLKRIVKEAAEIIGQRSLAHG